MKVTDFRDEGAAFEAYVYIVRVAAVEFARHGADFDESFSDGSLGLLRAIRGFRPEVGCSFETYARMKVRGEIIRGLTQRRPVNRPVFCELEEVRLPAVERHGDVLQLERLRAAISALPDRHRLAVNLFYFQDYSKTEVAGVLGVTDSRAGQILAAAVEYLREALEGEEKQPGDDSRLPRAA